MNHTLIKHVLRLLAVLPFFVLACSAQEKTASQTQETSDAKKPAAQKVLARVNGAAITEDEVVAQHKPELDQIDRDYHQKHYQILEGGVNQLIDDHLLTLEASAKGVGKDQILAQIHPAAVTDADVDNFYEQNKAQIGRPKEQIAQQIKLYLQQQNDLRARQAFFQELRSRYKVEFLLEPIRIDVAATGPAKGPADAPVTIVEFSDFQCPFCFRLIPVLEQMQQKYGNRVRLVFRQYPLTIHNFAQKAAEAALCANEQGKFWEMHDAMFHDQQGLAVDGLKSKAAALGLKADTFNQCLDSGKFAPTVKADLDAGAAVGVNSTPTLFINGRYLVGAVPLEEISKIIDDELLRKGVANPHP